MRKLVLQRWALIFLLVGRLVIGELGHAMPMGAHGPEMSSAMPHQMSELASDAAACPEHAGKTQPAPPHDHASTGHISTGEDCCKSGECECPCLHVPCAAVDAALVTSIAPELQRMPDGMDGLMLQRLSGLFRPPA